MRVIKCVSDRKLYSVHFTFGDDKRVVHIVTDAHNLPAIRELVRTSPLTGPRKLLTVEAERATHFIDSNGNRI